MVRGIDAKDGADLRAKWGDKPCEHPGVLREYVRGSATGDYICARCGEAGWGKDWVEKEKPEEKRHEGTAADRQIEEDAPGR